MESGPAIDSPTAQHQQARSLPMTSHDGPGSPTTLTHCDSLSSSSSENREGGAKETTRAAQTHAGSSGPTTVAGDDVPAPPVFKAGRRLPKPVTNFLRRWLFEHADHHFSAVPRRGSSLVPQRSLHSKLLTPGFRLAPYYNQLNSFSHGLLINCVCSSSSVTTESMTEERTPSSRTGAFRSPSVSSRPHSVMTLRGSGIR